MDIIFNAPLEEYPYYRRTPKNSPVIYEYSSTDAILEQLGKSQEQLIEDITSLKTWLQKQPHLPDDVSSRKLAIFIHLNKGNVEKTKKKLDAYYTVRSLLPEYFDCTFATSERMQKALDTCIIAPMPKLFNNERVIIAHTFVTTEDFDIVAIHSCGFHITEVLIAEDQCCGSLAVSDCSNLTVKYMLKNDLVILRNLKVVFQDVYSGRVSAIHIVNVKPIIEKVINAFKAMIKPKVAERIFIHSTFEDLHKAVPKECLPKEFGGTSVSLAELKEYWIQKLIDYEPHFQKLRKFKVDESLRPKELHSDLFEDLQGNFRKLDVD